jgi:hypothetical protein
MTTKRTILFLLSLFILFPFAGIAQEDNNRVEVLGQNINGLIIGGYYKVELFKGEPKVVIHGKSSVLEKINVEVRNGVLQISNKPLRHSKPIKIDIYSDYLQHYDISGAVILSSEEIQQPENLNIDVSGAAQIKIEVETKAINGTISGASILELAGTAEKVSLKATGASIVKTANLKTEKSDIVVTGAAGVLVTDEGPLVDTSEEEYNYENDIQATDEDGEKTTYGMTYDGSVARAKFLGIQVHVDEDDESGEVRIGSHKWVYDSEGEVTHKRVKLHKFNGHWGGVGIGINGYVNDKYSYELPEEYEFMDLMWQKSVNVDLNIYEQNINLSPNKNLGLVTGIGYSIYNYRFTKSFTVMQDSNYFSGTYNQGINVRKSKIVTNFITIPVLFEIQDNNPSPLTKHRWHVNVGAIFGVRVHSHQKTYFEETNKDYNLTQPISGDIVAVATSPSNNKAKVHDDFYLRPFKVDASLRVGWGWINLYANVSLTEMFSKNKGPQLHPFSVGIMLTSW